MSVEKVIEHLEKAKEFLSEFVPASGHNPLNWIGGRIDEALDLLRQQPVCKTCGGSGTVVNPTFGPDDPEQPAYLSCPDCQQPDLEAENKRLKEIINECRTRRGYAESEECGEDLDQILKGE